MDESSSDSESLYARIQELENERDELHKDIEQLCMQKAGPSYINVATQMYFRRTAGLEQEVENLKKKLADCTKENSNIKDELSEAKRIKTYMDQLHKLEVTKNTEVTKQLEYLRGVVAKAFSDRDHAIMEAEKAKENEELLSQKLNDAETRLQELGVGSTESEEKLMDLQMKLEKQEQELENFRKVINKFYKIRQHACRGNEEEESRVWDQHEDVSWGDKCDCLYFDSIKSWSFNVHEESSSANYVAALQEELETLRGSVDDLQNKIHMGLEIEKHLKRRVSVMEHKKILSDRLIMDGISSLRKYHSQQRIHIMGLLDDEKSYLQSVVGSIEQKIGQLARDIHSAEVTSSSIPNIAQTVDSSETLARALQEKVSALVLLSQQEERHIWEKNVHVAVQETMDELQKTIKLASDEKVNALVELAQVKQEYQLLLESIHESRQGNFLTSSGERRIVALGQDGRLKNLLKRTSLRRWLGTEENLPVVAPLNLGPEGSLNNRISNQSMDDARLRIEYATLKDSIHSLERLTSDIRKLRVSLIQAKMTRLSKGTSTSTSRQLDEIIREAELLKTALSSALPLSWSGEGDGASCGDVIVEENTKHEDTNAGKIDPVSAVGLEMVELLVLAAQAMKDRKSKREPRVK